MLPPLTVSRPVLLIDAAMVPALSVVLPLWVQIGPIEFNVPVPFLTRSPVPDRPCSTTNKPAASLLTASVPLLTISPPKLPETASGAPVPICSVPALIAIPPPLSGAPVISRVPAPDFVMLPAPLTAPVRFRLLALVRAIDAPRLMSLAMLCAAPLVSSRAALPLNVSCEPVSE